MSEQFAFHQVFRQARQLTATNGIGRPLAQVVDPAGDQFFAGPRFAQNQHVRIGRGDLVDQLLHPLHPGVAPTRSGLPSTDFRRLSRAILDASASAFRPRAAARWRSRQFARLGQKVVRAAAKGLDGLLHAAVARADDDFGLGRDLLDVSTTSQPLRPGIRRSTMAASKCAFRSRRSRVPVLANRRLVTHARQLDPHHFANRGFVVDKQDAQLIQSGGTQTQSPLDAWVSPTA